MKKKIQWMIILIALFVPLFVFMQACQTTQKREATGYVHTSGDGFVDGKGTPFIINAVGFGNGCWDNTPTPVYTYCDANSYKVISKMGFNAVRFYLNYGLLEDDEAPYVYKQTAWDWIDQNIAWAKANGIQLIFNMHYPQGGFQPAGNGMALWLNADQEQERLIALWKAIATRYASEPAVIGYGLVNEPVVPLIDSSKASLEQWRTLAQKITDAIRAVDANHVIFVEGAYGAKDMNTGVITTVLNDKNNLVRIQDSAYNTASELHFYQPASYTLASSAEAIPFSYPQEERMLATFSSSITWTGWEKSETKTDGRQDANDWRNITTGWKNISSDVFSALFSIASDLKDVWMDDIVIEWKEDNSQEAHVLETYPFNVDANWQLIGTDSISSYDGNVGCNAPGSLHIQTAKAGGYLQAREMSLFSKQNGRQYRISAKVKGDADILPAFSLFSAKNLKPFTIEYLKQSLYNMKEACMEYGTPLFLGEMGITSFATDYGGEIWLGDFLKACSQMNSSFSYHLYHGGELALYRNSSWQSPGDCNDAYCAVIEKHLTAK